MAVHCHFQLFPSNRKHVLCVVELNNKVTQYCHPPVESYRNFSASSPARHLIPLLSELHFQLYACLSVFLSPLLFAQPQAAPDEKPFACLGYKSIFPLLESHFLFVAHHTHQPINFPIKDCVVVGVVIVLLASVLRSVILSRSKAPISTCNRLYSD